MDDPDSNILNVTGNHTEVDYLIPEGDFGQTGDSFNTVAQREQFSSEDGVSLLTREAHPMSRETVLVFGQGPVIDAQTRLKASDVNTPPGQEDVNFWSYNLAKAAVELAKLDPSIQHFVVMGGPTGGKQYASEAHLIARKMQEMGLPQDAIKLEEMSNDTIENIVNFLNLHDNAGNINEQYSTLSAKYHSVRVGVLMRLFAVPVKHSFQSEEILRYVARVEPDPNNPSKYIPTYDPSRWDHQQLQTLEDQLDINNPTNFTSQKTGTEQRNIADRYIKDNLFIRELLQYPEKWLPYVGKLENNQRVQVILLQTEMLYPGMLQGKYGVQVTDDLASIKTKLQQITHTPLSEETMSQWAKENVSGDWPEEVLARVHKLINLS